MNHNLHRASHVWGPLALARSTALDRLYDPVERPAVGECVPVPLVAMPHMLIQTNGAATVRVRVIRWKR